MARDLNDVIQQMARHGIHLPARVDLQQAFSKFVRFRPDGQKSPKKNGYVRLHDDRFTEAGERIISGVYGVWSGTVNEQYLVEHKLDDWTPAQRAAWLEKRKAIEKAAAAEREREGETAADKARRMWKKGRAFREGEQHPYLAKKQVGAFGVRQGFNERLMVPLCDPTGEVHGLQYIAPDGSKVYGTGTIKEGRSHLLGQVVGDTPLLAFGEGYATCASAHMAMGWPVVVCFDAGNLAPVLQAWRKLYPELTFVVLADDDRHLLRRLSERLAQHGIVCTVDELKREIARGVIDLQWQIPDGPAVAVHAGWKNDAAGVARLEGTLTVNGEARELVLENAGQAKAHAAARKVKARVLTPFFADRDSPGTDWNDLHCALGLDSVREQLQAALEAPPEKPRANDRAQRGGGKGGGAGSGGGGGDGGSGEGSMLERYTLIYGTSTVWDAHQREIIRYEALKLARGRLADWWLRHDDRREVPQSRVVFDPSGHCGPPDYVNLFDRLPLELPPPAGASCARIVEHLDNLCKGDEKIFRWLVSWLAYPLQHPGAKMRTAVLIYGRTEGTGKSKVADVMRRIYGRYATSVGQPELQRDFNDYLSAKLFVIGEEVVARQDRVHLQGVLQNLIDRPTVQINTKNMPIREEANHANFMLFSNQQIPASLNATDRRYFVLKVEQEHPPDYFAAIDAEVAEGGAQAFYQYLLEWDLQDFTPFTRPPATRDRLRLITLGMSPDQRFFEYWRSELAGVPFVTCPAHDLYSAFKAWCKVNGERFVPTATSFGGTIGEQLDKLGAPEKKSVRYWCYSDKAVADGDWSSEQVQRQGVVYWVPESLRRKAQLDGDGGQPAVVDTPEGAEPPDPKAPATRDAAIKLFQAQLHELLQSARRSL